MDSSLQAMIDTVVRVNSQASQAAGGVAKSLSPTPSLVIEGGGTKRFYRETSAELQGREVLSTRTYSGIIDYEPSELVFTAKAGTPLLEIERTLESRGQMLGFEPPYFGEHATIGGVVATGLSGPRRAAAGGVRDFVLGTTVISHQGELLRFGGQVMKNVAGYDVSRLMTGSLGVLGVIVEVSIKVLPLPLATTTLVLEANQVEALKLMNQWGGQPLPITATCYCDGRLYVRLAGAQSAISSAMSVVGGEVLQSADSFWIAVREQTHPFFKGGNLWRLSLPSAAPASILAEGTLIEWNGSQRWIQSDQPARLIRQEAVRLGGTACLFKCLGNATVNESRFHPLEPVAYKINQKLKQQFDPHQIFNVGRMYAGL